MTELVKSVGIAGAVLLVLVGVFTALFRQMFGRVLKHLDDVVPVLGEIRDSLKALHVTSDHGRVEAVQELRELVKDEADRVIREVHQRKGVRS